jgi:hypothetical protein
MLSRQAKGASQNYPEHANTKLLNIKTIILNSDSSVGVVTRLQVITKEYGTFLVAAQVFPRLQVSRMTLGPTQPPIQLEQEVFSSGRRETMVLRCSLNST